MGTEARALYHCELYSTYTMSGLGSVLSSSNTSFLKKGFFTLYLKLFPVLHKTMSQLTSDMNCNVHVQRK